MLVVDEVMLSKNPTRCILLYRAYIEEIHGYYCNNCYFSDNQACYE
jgi:hypothetical protein